MRYLDTLICAAQSNQFETAEVIANKVVQLLNLILMTLVAMTFAIARVVYKLGQDARDLYQKLVLTTDKVETEVEIDEDGGSTLVVSPEPSPEPNDGEAVQVEVEIILTTDEEMVNTTNDLWSMDEKLAAKVDLQAIINSIEFAPELKCLPEAKQVKKSRAKASTATNTKARAKTKAKTATKTKTKTVA